VERLLGQGGMGAVYLVARDDDQYRKQAALKLAQRDFGSPQDLVRFRIERQILADLDHPAIARLVDGGETEEGIPYLVMEYVDGEPITRYADRRRLSIPDRLGLFADVCEAVAYAHRHAIIHRDLKPSNLLVTSEGSPKLLDFGIAKLLTPALGTAQTVASLRLFTPEYASPEQVRGLPISTATDVYGLGLVLYELLTGEKAQPLKTGSPAELVERVCEREAPLASAVDGELAAILQKALVKDPVERYSSVDLFQDDLRRYLEGLPLHARPPTFFYRAAKFVRRRRWAVAAAAVLLASLAGGVGATLYQARRAERRFQQVAPWHERCCSICTMKSKNCPGRRQRERRSSEPRWSISITWRKTPPGTYRCNWIWHRHTNASGTFWGIRSARILDTPARLCRTTKRRPLSSSSLPTAARRTRRFFDR
jgi:serine/threonine protein kinase